VFYLGSSHDVAKSSGHELKGYIHVFEASSQVTAQYKSKGKEVVVLDFALGRKEVLISHFQWR
jgi:hypothetical protein